MKPVEASRPSAEPVFFEQTWDLAYRHALGNTVATFLEGLRERRLLGRRCDSCERVLFPARSFCDRCHEPSGDWAELEPHGTLEMFTIVTEPFPGTLVEPPYILAYVRPDGADTAAVGYLKGLDLSDVRSAAAALATGTRVEVRFRENPEGKMTDFWYELVDDTHQTREDSVYE